MIITLSHHKRTMAQKEITPQISIKRNKGTDRSDFVVLVYGLIRRCLFTLLTINNHLTLKKLEIMWFSNRNCNNKSSHKQTFCCFIKAGTNKTVSLVFGSQSRLCDCARH